MERRKEFLDEGQQRHQHILYSTGIPEGGYKVGYRSRKQLDLGLRNVACSIHGLDS